MTDVPRMAYLIALTRMGRLPYFWSLHRMLSRTRRHFFAVSSPA